MEPRNPSLDAARRTILLEADALQQVARQLTPDFDRVLDTVLQAPGRLIVRGSARAPWWRRKPGPPSPLRDPPPYSCMPPTPSTATWA